MKKNIDFILSAPIAHRGLHGDGVPENSLKAFESACKAGYIIELDVHLASDGKIIVFHDDNLKRMSGSDMFTKNLSSQDLKTMRLKNSRQHIPLLSEVLDLVNDRVPLIIEVKNDVRAKEICPVLLKELSDYAGRFVVKSFDPRILHYFRKNAPYIGRGQLVTNNNAFLKNMCLNWWTRPDFISYDVRCLPNRRVENVRKKIPVLGWTVRTKADFAIAKKYCDNYIFENV